MEFNATFIIAFVNFVIFIFIMNFILYKPIYKITSERKKIIDDNYEAAKTNSSKSEVILKEREEKLAKAGVSSKEKYKLAFEDTNSIKNKTISKAKEEVKKGLEESKNQIDEEIKNTIEPLKKEVISLAQLISDKFLQSHEEIQEIDEQYIKDAIQG